MIHISNICYHGAQTTHPMIMRLDKFLCKSTDLLLDQARHVIEQGEVEVNQKIITQCDIQVHENNHIEWQGKQLTPRPSRYIMLHKPQNTQCSNVDGHYPSVMQLLDIERQDELHIAGRLDADTTGLLLITDDGRWSFNITQPKQQCLKTYRVDLRDASDKKYTNKQLIEMFQQGLALQGEENLTRPAQLEIISPQQVLLTISEGKYHQVKRMFAAVGNKVVKLHREKIGKIELDIEENQWRYLTDEEASSFT